MGLYDPKYPKQHQTPLLDPKGPVFPNKAPCGPTNWFWAKKTNLGVGSSERIDDSEGFVNALKERYNAVFGFSEGAWCCLGHLVSCRAILDHEGPISCYFRPIRHPCGPLKRPQSGPIWHIVVYYAPEKCFRATCAIFLKSRGFEDIKYDTHMHTLRYF